MSEQTVSWRTKQISSVCRELKQELHDILKLNSRRFECQNKLLAGERSKYLQFVES